jgi:hypothetical protein
MQDGERREGRDRLLEGGKEGDKMCRQCVSTYFLLRIIYFEAAVIKGSYIAREGHHPVKTTLQRGLGSAKERML